MTALPPAAPQASFADRLLDWWTTHGRHDLPWQRDRTPYRVWVAEIMLQQTQVRMVIPYFERFTAAFPDLETLAHAPTDVVLAHWSGLGYYARARNLHAAAIYCLEHHGGKLPADADALDALPGIGRSTANAIVAQAHDQPAPILDGNVKRVLARHAGIEGWPGRAAVERALWARARACTPDDRASDYTQAIMDLGAMICSPRRPDCQQCPVAADCIARLTERVDELPAAKPKRARPRRKTTLIIIENERGEVLLQRRPPAGIWGGLWSLPEREEMERLPVGDATEPPETIVHQFTHFTLDIHFERIYVRADSLVSDGNNSRWLKPADALRRGLPQPIRRVMEQL